MFNRLVHPIMRFVTAVLPQMRECREGKIIVVNSATPLRAVPALSAYAAARAAQNGYVKVVGAEVSSHNVQLNAIAQHFTIGGFPEDAMQDPQTARWVEKEVPAQRLSRGVTSRPHCVCIWLHPKAILYRDRLFPLRVAG